VAGIFDLGASFCDFYGLVLTYASVYQMLRGSVIIFTGILTILILRTSLKPHRWTGIILATSGIALAGYTNFLAKNGKEESNDIIWGIVVLLLGGFLHALQNIFEEKLLKGSDVTPVYATCVEGIWGIFAGIILLPVFYFIPGKDVDGKYENSLDTIKMIENNYMIGVLGILEIICIPCFMASSLEVAKRLSSVHRTIIDSSRIILIWVTQLILYYSTHGDMGEAWATESYIELAGFALLILGFFVHNAILKLPCFDYKEGKK